MNNERYNQIIDEAYKNYLKHNDEVDNYWIKKNPEIEIRWKPYSKEEFINKCITAEAVAEMWGLKIEERELSLEERALWLENNGWELLVGNLDHDHVREVVETESPTKLITVTYNNETIEFYE